MDEIDNTASKTYTLEEILALQSKGEEIPPASGARDWIDNPTRFKLREAKHFLNAAHREFTNYLQNTTDENRDDLLFSLSAFFSSIRSITGDYMGSQYGDKPGFKIWYQQQNLASDPELVFLNKIRVAYVHLKPRIIATERGVSCGLKANVVYGDTDPRKETAPPLPETLSVEPVTFETTTSDLIFQLDEEMKKLGLDKDLSVLDFCDRKYEKIKSLVYECESRFYNDTESRPMKK